jgi:hypothetical protein
LGAGADADPVVLAEEFGRGDRRRRVVGVGVGVAGSRLTMMRTMIIMTMIIIIAEVVFPCKNWIAVTWARLFGLCRSVHFEYSEFDRDAVRGRFVGSMRRWQERE